MPRGAGTPSFDNPLHRDGSFYRSADYPLFCTRVISFLGRGPSLVARKQLHTIRRFHKYVMSYRPIKKSLFLVGLVLDPDSLGNDSYSCLKEIPQGHTEGGHQRAPKRLRYVGSGGGKWFS